jgi:hypothetical protein
MLKKLLIASLIIAKTVSAIGPTIECRFAALSGNGTVELDEVVPYTLDPTVGLAGDFPPYGFDVSVHQNALTVAVYVNGEPLTGTEIPVINVVNLPLGATVFGVNTVYHPLVDGLESLRYECRKVLWQ